MLAMAVSRILTLLALTAVSTLVAAEHGDTTCTMQPQPQLGKHMALVQLTNRLRSTGSKPSTLTDFERDYIEDGRGPCCTEQRAECLSCAEDIAVIAWCEDPRHTDVPGCEGIPTTSHRPYHSSWRHAGSEQGASDYAHDGAQDGAAGHGGASSNATGHEGGFAAHGTDGADGAGGSTTTTVSTTTTTVIECVTREDPRVSAVGYTTSPPGTPCVFGVDARDEGEHCIFDSGAYGSFGWCYTSDAGDSWGSCAESCPLFGPSKVLGERIEHLEKKLAKALSTTTTTSSSSSSTTTNTTTTTTTASTTEAPSTSTTTSSTTSKASTSTTVQVSTSMEESNATTSTTITTSTSTATNATKSGPGAHSAKSGGPGAKGGSSSNSDTSDTDSDKATKGGSSSDADMMAKE